MSQQQQVDPNQLLQAMQIQVAAQVGEMLQKKVRFISRNFYSLILIIRNISTITDIRAMFYNMSK